MILKTEKQFKGGNHMQKVISFIKTIDLKSIKPHTIVSLIAMVLSYVNMALLYTDKPIINVGTDELNAIVGIVYTIVVTLYGWYKNQSVTKPAQALDKLLIHMRDGKLTKDELTDLIENYGDEETIDFVKKDLTENK